MINKGSTRVVGRLVQNIDDRYDYDQMYLDNKININVYVWLQQQGPSL